MIESGLGALPIWCARVCFRPHPHQGGMSYMCVCVFALTFTKEVCSVCVCMYVFALTAKTIDKSI
jgi:hypothetical protein